jgi:hypothetical protein
MGFENLNTYTGQLKRGLLLDNWFRRMENLGFQDSLVQFGA